MMKWIRKWVHWEVRAGGRGASSSNQTAQRSYCKINKSQQFDITSLILIFTWKPAYLWRQYGAFNIKKWAHTVDDRRVQYSQDFRCISTVIEVIESRCSSCLKQGLGIRYSHHGRLHGTRTIASKITQCHACISDNFLNPRPSSQLIKQYRNRTSFHDEVTAS